MARVDISIRADLRLEPPVSARTPIIQPTLSNRACTFLNFDKNEILPRPCPLCLVPLSRRIENVPSFNHFSLFSTVGPGSRDITVLDCA